MCFCLYAVVASFELGSSKIKVNFFFLFFCLRSFWTCRSWRSRTRCWRAPSSHNWLELLDSILFSLRFVLWSGDSWAHVPALLVSCLFSPLLLLVDKAREKIDDYFQTEKETRKGKCVCVGGRGGVCWGKWLRQEGTRDCDEVWGWKQRKRNEGKLRQKEEEWQWRRRKSVWEWLLLFCAFLVFLTVEVLLLTIFGTYQPYCNYKCNLFTSYLIQFFPVHNRERTCSDEDKINKDKKKIKNRTFAFLIRNCDTTFEVSFACYAEDTVQKNILYKSSLCF